MDRGVEKFFLKWAVREFKKGVGAWGLSYHKKVRRSTPLYQSTKKPYTRRGEPRFTKYKKVSCIKRHTISIYLLPRSSWPKIKWPKKKSFLRWETEFKKGGRGVGFVLRVVGGSIIKKYQGSQEKNSPKLKLFFNIFHKTYNLLF